MIAKKYGTNFCTLFFWGKHFLFIERSEKIGGQGEGGKLQGDCLQIREESMGYCHHWGHGETDK